ncbi:MAG: hypothetical protein HC812_07055 [Leptolyngbya sp. RL_3_1]|nr:hypothetical protein [Leptolyngbya sp. RL_3_1]
MIMLLGLALVGCPDPRQTGYSAAETSAVPVAATVTPTADGLVQNAVPYDICADLANWVRPAPEVQQQTLQQDPRYSNDLETEPLRTLSEQFWTQPVITFTTYGLSARLEPMNLSGVWTATDQIEPCYTGDRPLAINQGDWAEVWIIGHRLSGLEWSNGQYQLTVEPASKGLQVVQFERQEAQAVLTVVATTSGGEPVPAISGDW